MGYVDHRGGLVCEPSQVVEYPIPIKRGILRRIRGVSLSTERNEFKSAHKQDVCWICQGWQEIEFRNSRPSNCSESFVHLDFENYAPVKMQPLADEFRTVRMCPVGDIKFYFTLTPPTREVASPYHEVADTEFPGKQGLSVNRQKVGWTSGLFEDDFTVNCRCLPRSEVNVIPQFK